MLTPKALLSWRREYRTWYWYWYIRIYVPDQTLSYPYWTNIISLPTITTYLPNSISLYLYNVKYVLLEYSLTTLLTW